MTSSPLTKIENYSDEAGRVHRMVKGGHFFSVEELLQMGNPRYGFGDTVAHRMVQNGFGFNLNELLLLGNPGNDYGLTLAHEMAARGYDFSVEELIALQNPKAIPDVYLTWHHYRIPMPFFEEDTPAHVMARRGYCFSDFELDQLGVDKQYPPFAKASES